MRSQITRFFLVSLLNVLISMDPATIKAGDYIVLEGGDIHQLVKIDTNACRKLGVLGQVKLDKLIGHSFYSYVKYIKSEGKFEVTAAKVDGEGSDLQAIEEPTANRDNRNLDDTSTAQRVDLDAISELKREAKFDDIVPQLIAGSETFEGKSTFAQRKYIQKKKAQYEVCFFLRPPTLRDICQPRHAYGDIFVHHHNLQYVIDKAGVFYQSNCLLFDESMGLVASSILQILSTASTASPTVLGKLVNVVTKKHKFKRRFAEMLGVSIDESVYTGVTLLDNGKDEANSCGNAQLLRNDSGDLMTGRFTSLVIVSRTDADIWFDALFPFLEVGGSFAILSASLAALESIEYRRKEWKSSKPDGCAFGMVQAEVVELSSRQYQIIPNCTHPIVPQSPHAGYVFSGVKVGLSE